MRFGVLRRNEKKKELFDAFNYIRDTSLYIMYSGGERTFNDLVILGEKV